MYLSDVTSRLPLQKQNILTDSIVNINWACHHDILMTKMSSLVMAQKKDYATKKALGLNIDSSKSVKGMYRPP